MDEVSSPTRLELKIDPSFPGRKAATVLKSRIMDYLASGEVQEGDPFFTDGQLVEMSGLSRSTVWRALDQLRRDGWIDRQIGRGTFIGPRAGVPRSIPAIGSKRITGASSTAIRLAVSMFSVRERSGDWYTPLVLAGIDAGVEQHEIRIELLGTQDKDIDAISRRLTKSMPDVLTCLSADPRASFLLRDAQRLGIPTITVGTPMISLGLPTVYEDNAQGMGLAVSHLVERGHRRIGLILQMHAQPWVTERHHGYTQALERAGIEEDGGLILHMRTTQPQESDDAADDDRIDRIERYLRREKPTAVILGHYRPLAWVAEAARRIGLRVPEDLSIISFDQKPQEDIFGGNFKLTTIALPLHEIGMRIARMAGEIIRGGVVDKQVCLPCTLIQGNSVHTLA